MKQRISVLFIALLFFISCSSDEPTISPIPEEGSVQVTLMYFAGLDLNLYYDTNIAYAKSAVKAGALGDYGLLYYFLPTTSSDAKLFELSYDNGECVEREVMIYDDISSITPEALTQVINDMKSDVGAEIIAAAEINLVWGSHGMGWVLTEYDGGSTASLSGRSTDSSYGERVDQGVDEQLIPTRYVGLTSKSSEGAMDIDDLCQAITDSNTRFGYILFDACLMSSVEVLYRLRNYCDYIVASPAEVMAKGFPYTDVIPELFTDSGTTYNLEGVCQAYYNYYMYETSNHYGTIAMCVTSELEALAASLSKITRTSLSTSQRNALQSYEGLSSPAFFDLLEYIEVAGGTDENLAAFQAQFEVTFPAECRLHTSSYYSNTGNSGSYTINYYSGVSTSEPSINTSYNAGWSEEPWSVASR